MSKFTFEVAVDDNASNPRHPFKTFTTLLFSEAARSENPSLQGDCHVSDDELDELMNDSEIVLIPVHATFLEGKVFFSTEHDAQRFDGGMVGVMYVEKSKVKAQFGDLSAETHKKVWRQFIAELHEFSCFVNGWVYAWTVRDSQDLPVASAGGYCSRELAIQGAKDKILEMQPKAA